jgi:hypothetical protein
VRITNVPGINQRIQSPRKRDEMLEQNATMPLMLEAQDYSTVVSVGLDIHQIKEYA